MVSSNTVLICSLLKGSAVQGQFTLEAGFPCFVVTKKSFYGHYYRERMVHMTCDSGVRH